MRPAVDVARVPLKRWRRQPRPPSPAPPAGCDVERRLASIVRRKCPEQPSSQDQDPGPRAAGVAATPSIASLRKSIEQTARTCARPAHPVGRIRSGASGRASPRYCPRPIFATVATDGGTGEATIRRPRHEPLKPRRLQLKATSRLSWHSSRTTDLPPFFTLFSSRREAGAG